MSVKGILGERRQTPLLSIPVNILWQNERAWLAPEVKNCLEILPGPEYVSAALQWAAAPVLCRW